MANEPFETPEEEAVPEEVAGEGLPADDLVEAEIPMDYEAILADYRRRQMLVHLAGPLVSLIVHVAMISCAAVFMVGTSSGPDQAGVEVKMEELEVKELEPKVVEELKKLEIEADEAVPPVEKPDVPQEMADIKPTQDFSDDMAVADDMMDLSDVLDIRPSQTKLKLSMLYGGRTSKGREEKLKKFGGSSVTETAVGKALRWLKGNQNEDGSWSKTKEKQPAMAALALLAYMAHGDGPTSEEFGETVQRAIEYLVEQTEAVSEEDPPIDWYWPYRNGMTTYALSEAYGLTKVPYIKPAMEKGLRIIVRGQQPRGGWDYQYCQGARWDLTATAWQVQALKAGYVANAEVDGLFEAMDKGATFLKDVAYEDGKFQYCPLYPGNWGIQGCGTLCLQLTGHGNSKEARQGIREIYANEKVEWKEDGLYLAKDNPCYNWYYETQVMFHAGQTAWKKWNDQFSRVLVRNQRRDGRWDCPGVGSEHPEYDPYYTTCLNCLSLQVYYRYLPSFKIPKPIAKKKTSVLDILDDELGLEIE